MYKIDRVDKKIADLLMEDGRMPAAEIARRVGDVSERSVRYRLANLIKEGIILICAIPQPKALGYAVVADVFLEVEPSYIREVAYKIKDYECVSYVAFSIGENDVSVQVIARDNQEIYQFVTEVIGKLPGVRKTTTSIVPVTLKDVYQWRIPASTCVDSAPV